MGHIKAFVAIVVLLSVNYAVLGKKKCRALTMSGGGDKGPYQAAVFKGLVDILPAEDVTYDVLVGVSAGALNSLTLSPFEPHEVKEAAQFGHDLWNTIPNYDAYGQWPGGMIEGILFQKGAFNIQPGIDWVNDQFKDKKVHRKVTFSTTSANSGKYRTLDFNATGTQPENFIMSAFASCIIPFAFGQINLDGDTLLDGGCKWKLDVITTIRRCKEVVDDEADIIVDMILCANPTIPERHDIASYKTLDHFMRRNEMRDYYNTLNDYNSSIHMFPDVTFRYLIAPSESITSGLIPLNYNQEQIDRCFRVGEKDARIAVQLGHGGYANAMFEHVEKIQRGEHSDFNEIISTRLAMMNQTHAESE